MDPKVRSTVKCSRASHRQNGFTGGVKFGMDVGFDFLHLLNVAASKTQRTTNTVG